ncbi:MAG: hypothetical protein ABJA82_07635 [Myxococcales bacterium]
MRKSGPFLVAIAVLAWSNLRCAPGQGAATDAGSMTSGTGGSGTGGSGTGGSGGAAQGSGGGGVVAGTGGGGTVAPASGGSSGSGGSVGATGGVVGATGGVVAATGGRGGVGGFDDGRLFTDAGVAPPATGGSVGSSGGATGVDAGPVNRTATCAIPSVGLTAVFTQTGADVTVVVTANNCASGSHVLTIRGGFSCDSASTQGGIWGNTRGTGLGTFTCNASKQGMLTYTRSGKDPALAWTVGDHNTNTDVTLHPMMLDSNCGTFF